MGVVSWDEAIEADNLHFTNRGLDILLPLAGALREYNTTVAGRELLVFGDNDDISISALTYFLNKFVRFPTEFIGGLAGAEFDSHKLFCSWFGSWYCQVEAGFKFEEALREVASAFGLASVKTFLDLAAEKNGYIEFRSADSSAVHNVDLLASLKTAARSEPLAIAMFRDVERFKPIDDVPVLNAVASLVSGLDRVNLADAAPTSPSQSPFRVRLSPAEERIVEVVKRKECRLTTTQIHSALEDVEATSLGMVKQSLAFLVRIGVLDNKQDAEPPGYGLGPNHGQTRKVSFG